MPRLAALRAPLLAITVLAGMARLADAQSAAELARGDAALRDRRPADALAHYEAALARSPDDGAASWRAASALAELAEFDTMPASRRDRLARAEAHARTAVRARPTGVEARFALARVVGQQARAAAAPTERARLGRETYEQARACLALAPEHPGCLHVLGVWHATVAALDPLSRRTAAVLAGSDVFDAASRDEGVRLLAAAARLEPTRVAHALELGLLHAARGDRAASRRWLATAERGALLDANDAHRRALARQALARQAPARP